MNTETSPNLNMPLILVTDDDSRLRRLLNKYLSENGFRVFSAADTKEADALMKWFVFDLVIADVMMPVETGVEFTRRLRERGETVPVLMLTAMGETNDRINGLEAGADDYLPKPFEPRELLLRINNILRRVMSKPPEKQKAEVRFGIHHYDLDEKALYRGSERIRLPLAESALLQVLAERAGQDISREELAQKTGNETNLRTVDVQITRLRRKIEPDVRQPKYIQTIRGKGYSLIPD
ncbi:two-component response transcriptional regulator (OmpR family) [Acetobacter sp. CAG:977]|nr:two-component response transcriptional regulator (OmpR family) [Acetobacter sp. CAG:977]